MSSTAFTSTSTFLLFFFFFLVFFFLVAPKAHAHGGPSPSIVPGDQARPRCLQPKDFANEKLHKAYLVIQTFKKTVTSDPKGITKTWVGPHVCSYRGFTCATPPDGRHTTTVATVDFNGFNLSAPTLSGFINSLPDVAVFHVHSNNFSGTIPSLSGSAFLSEVDVSSNHMGGSFPTAAVAGIKGLQFLDLRFNSFSGRLPPSLFDMKLDVLFLNDNFLTGPLPENLGKTTARYLTLANNGFSGPIPTSIGDAADTLREVLFLNNKLSGHLPCEIGLLKNATVVDASNNRITGGIPSSVGCLKSIEQLNLANNHLYGGIPESLCQLPTLHNLTLSGNYLTSIGPSCLKLWKRNKLHLRRNCILSLPHRRPLDQCAPYISKPSQHRHRRCSLSCNPSVSATPPPPPPPPPPTSAAAPAPSSAYAALLSHQQQ